MENRDFKEEIKDWPTKELIKLIYVYSGSILHHDFPEIAMEELAARIDGMKQEGKNDQKG